MRVDIIDETSERKQRKAIDPEDALREHRLMRDSLAALVRYRLEVYVDVSLSISARINLVYVPFFIIGELSVRMQLAERAIEQQLGGIALFKRSIGSQMEPRKRTPGWR